MKHHFSINVTYKEQFFHLRTLEHEGKVTSLKFMELLIGSFHGIFISAILYTHLHSCAITTEKQLCSVFVFQARSNVRASVIPHYTQRNVFFAYRTRFKNVCTLTSFNNGIVGYASLVMCADHRIEGRACQIHTSAALFEPPWGLSASNSEGIGV